VSRWTAGPDARRFARSSFLLGGSEEDQDLELFLNIVEPMFQLSLDENDRTGAHLGVVGSDLHAGTSSDDVVHLVFTVRFLGIGAASRQDIHAGAHGRNAEEFEVEFVFACTLAGEIVDMEEVGHKEQFSVPGSQFSVACRRDERCRGSAGVAEN
jgi:hypothetical protein